MNYSGGVFQKPEWIALMTFFVLSVTVWVFGDLFATIFLYVPGDIEEGPVFERATVVMQILITALMAALSYLALIRYNSFNNIKNVAEEMVSDLMLSREQFRMLYEGSPVPYFLMDDVGNIRNPNRAALRFFGGTSDECVAANFYALLTNEKYDTQAISLLRTKVERAVPITKEEICIKTLKGSTQWALVSIYSLDRTSPIPFKHLITLIDVTKERESEQVKTDFLLLASHQLRTPLTTIKWYIDYLLTTKTLNVPKVVQEYLEQIYIGNERMIGLVTTLLTVSRIEMGTLAPEYKAVHIDEVIEDVLQELATDIQKKALDVHTETEGDDVLTTDHTMVRIAIHNLMTNAIKYTSSGGTVRVVTSYGPHMCTITVSDSGLGIPLAEQDKIFTKMFRAANARKVSATGTGLGLYLTKAFVQKLGGGIEFTSEPDKGTTFTISLPRVAPDA